MHDRRCGRPKIANLLALPEARLLREELKLARSLGVAPTRLRGRSLFTTYLYEDDKYPDRLTKAVHAPEYTSDDWGLLLGLQEAEDLIKASETPCGWPRDLAYHADSDGWWERTSIKCFPCSEGQDDDVYHDTVRSTLPPDRPLAPFEISGTTVTKT